MSRLREYLEQRVDVCGDRSVQDAWEAFTVELDARLELVAALVAARDLWYDAWEWERRSYDPKMEAVRLADARVGVAMTRVFAADGHACPIEELPSHKQDGLRTFYCKSHDMSFTFDRTPSLCPKAPATQQSAGRE